MPRRRGWRRSTVLLFLFFTASIFLIFLLLLLLLLLVLILLILLVFVLLILIFLIGRWRWFLFIFEELGHFAQLFVLREFRQAGIDFRLGAGVIAENIFLRAAIDVVGRGLGESAKRERQQTKT